MPKHLPYNELSLNLTEKIFVGGTSVKPHPDGQPWNKCCNEKGEACCGFMRKDGNDSRAMEKALDGTILYPPVLNGEHRFFCIHRLADGYNRVCAGWDAWTRGLEIKENKNKG